MSEIAASATLVGRALDGRTKTWEIKADAPVDLPGSALVTQRVRVAPDDTMLVRRSLRRGSADPAYVLLDNEIRALARLSRAFPNEWARPFPTLVGYDVDSREPWALVSDYRGQPAREAVTGLLGKGQIEFATRLLDALARLALVEVVHNRLSLDGMYLARTTLSIVNFEYATFFGEPPQNRSGRGARPEDDLLDAGLLLYEVLTGEPAQSELPNLAEVPLLRSQLPDLFAELRLRPSAADALRRFVVPAEVPVLNGYDPLAAGRAAFDEARGKKYPAAPEPAPVEVPGPVRRKGRWSR
ncbi:MAG TPA: hypothetical protein VGR06_24310 [Actinophytocola sp.]|uniref:hypothetical protein n=1 Tax=Actinophytocola sp. TaxID=1872138 RepID=UPI002DF93B86|nr:hypothetical protein [Actinophytocola sp.]